VTETTERSRTAERPQVPADDSAADQGLSHDLERALRPRRENIVQVEEPLALICQAQRSGGTLLAWLFDGHRQCHTHPHELLIGYPKPHTWPELALDEAPETWFAKLKEGYLSTLFRKGRRVMPMKAPGQKSKGSYPFLLPPTFQRAIFLQEVERRSPITSERQILDCYMTSLFNAWLDNQNLRGPDKRWVVAFSPRRAWGEGREKLFELYPDGRLISILRDPESWFTSAQGRDPEAPPEALLDLWKRSAREMVEAKGSDSKRVFVLRFDELVRDTEQTMRALAGFLGIDFDPVLVTPTFNGYPVGANSSYEVRSTGVVTDPVERHKELLDDERRQWILAECKELYEEALGVVDRKPTRRRSSGSRSATKKRPSSSTSRKSTASRSAKTSTARKASGTPAGSGARKSQVSRKASTSGRRSTSSKR
jgi:hypothetical protein